MLVTQIVKTGHFFLTAKVHFLNTRSRHWPVPWDSWIQSTLPTSYYFKIH